MYQSGQFLRSASRSLSPHPVPLLSQACIGLITSAACCPPDGRRITHHETKFYWTKIQLAAHHSRYTKAFVCGTGNFLVDVSHITAWRVLLAARDRNGDLVVVIAIGLALVLLYCLEQIFHRSLNQTPRTVRLDTQSLPNLLKTEPILPDHQKSHLRPRR